MDEERLIDERALRRALRLDADERPPRLDAAALRAMAERPSTSPWLAMVAGTALALIAVAAAAAGLRVAVELAALVLSGTALDFAVGAVTFLSPAIELALSFVTQPSTPLAILACALLAIYYERRSEGKEQHARAS